MNTAEAKDRLLATDITRSAMNAGKPVAATIQQAKALRRAALTLHRWAEEECNGTIQRTDGTDRPHRRVETKVWDRLPGGDPGNRFHSWPIPDREAGALRRVKAVCEAAGLHFYHQTDPRGCSLYVASVPLNAQNYSTTGVCCQL